VDYFNSMKLFIWDFHGTLEKGNVKALHIILNRVAEEHKLDRRITFEKTVQWYGLSWIDYFLYLKPGASIEECEAMKQRAFTIQEEGHIIEQYIKPTDYAQDVLSKIAAAGHRNIIMSNSQKDQIQWFAQLVGLKKHITEYIGLDSHSEQREHTEIKKLKAGALLQFVHSGVYDRIIKIGDRQSDIEAGVAIGAVTYLYRNEFNANEKMTVRADFEITDLREVLKEA